MKDQEIPQRKRVLLTGAGGFIGAHVLEHLLESTDWWIVCTDSFRHKGKTDRISDVLNTDTGVCGPRERRERVKVIMHDLRAPISTQMKDQLGDINYILAVASESHVDRSITEPVEFIRNNTEVALSTLEFAKEHIPLEHLIWVSTDEVYGPITGTHDHKEWAPILPSNPYSASKAAQEAMAIAYWRTYGVPLTIVNCMNLIGERQDPEKYLPMLISRISNGEKVQVHGSKEEIGTRHYLHARNLADAMLFLLRKNPPLWSPVIPGLPPVMDDAVLMPNRYNVVGPDRVNNLELAVMVSEIIGKPLKYRLVDFHRMRPGHDAHYGLDPAKLTDRGWKPPISFTDSLERTVRWTLAHPEWVKE